MYVCIYIILRFFWQNKELELELEFSYRSWEPNYTPGWKEMMQSRENHNSKKQRANQHSQSVSKMSVSTSSGKPKHCNGPFAASGHMVQNPPCWSASCPLGHPEQSDFIKTNLHFLCFGCPSA